MSRVLLKKGRERSLLRRHPWIFSGAVHRLEGKPQSGESIDVFSHENRFLGRGAFSPSSQIRIRVWTFDESEKVIDYSIMETHF